MIFQTKTAISDPCLKKFRITEFLAVIFGGLFTAFEIGYVFHQRNTPTVSFLVTAICALVYFLFLRFIYSGTILVNKIIDQIETVSGTVRIQTFPSSMLFVYKKEPLALEMSAALLEIRSSDLKYGIDRKYTGNIYVVSYVGVEYLLAEKFFDEFDKLKIALNF
jgi:hypothetical protein